MHQSRKEQGLERTSRKLLHADFREAAIMAELDNDMEVAAEWAGEFQPSRRKTLSKM